MATFLDVLEKHLGDGQSAIQSKVAERENKINTIIKESFVGKYPTKELAVSRIRDDFALELCVSEDLDVDFLKENKDLLIKKVELLSEGEIKIIINNDVNRGKGGGGSIVIPTGDGIELESKKPTGKRGRPKKVTAVEPPVIVEEEEIEMPEQTVQFIVDKSIEFGLNKEATINLVSNMFTNNELAPKIIDSEFVSDNLEEISDTLGGMDDEDFAGDVSTEESPEEEESEELPDEEEPSEDDEEPSEDEDLDDEEEGEELPESKLRFNKKGFFGPMNESAEYLKSRGFLVEDDESVNARADQRQNVAEDKEELDEDISPNWKITLKGGMTYMIRAKEILSDVGSEELHLPGGTSIALPARIIKIEEVYSEAADNDDHQFNLGEDEDKDDDIEECNEPKSKFSKFAEDSLKNLDEAGEEIEFDVGEDGEGEAESVEDEDEESPEHEESETPEEEEEEHEEGGEEEGEEEEESEEEEEEIPEEPKKATLSPDSVDVEKDGKGIKISLKFDDIKDLIANFENEESEEESEEEESEDEETNVDLFAGEDEEEIEDDFDDEDEIEIPDEEESEETPEEEEEEHEEGEEDESEEAGEDEEETSEEEIEDEEEEEVKESAEPSVKKKTTYVVTDDGKDKLELDFEYDESEEDPSDEYVKDYVTKTYGDKATFRKKV